MKKLVKLVGKIWQKRIGAGFVKTIVGRRNEKTKLKEREIKKRFPEYRYIVTNVPRSGKYDEERLKKLFKAEAIKVARARKVLS